ARRATVSLGGNWGEVRLGRDSAPQFWNLTLFDPFNTNGAGAALTFQALPSTVATQARASNTFGYFLPGNIGGFYGQAQYYLGENANVCTGTGTPLASCVGSKDDGTGYGFRLGYAAGPFNLALAMSKTDYAVTSLAGGDWRQNNVGG